jgi:cytochrome c553
MMQVSVWKNLKRMSTSKIAGLISACLLASFVSGAWMPCRAQLQPHPSAPAAARKVDKKGINQTPETLLGERLFLETRFAQYFAAHSNGNVNRPLQQGDPLVAQVKNPRAPVPYPSPFAGMSINCRTCHFVDEFSSLIAGTNRTYADFLPRTPIPDRGDGRTVTTRNSRNLVDIFIPQHPGVLLHGDGEFSNAATLVEGTLSGRDFGWLPKEQKKAVHHIATVIREDDGRDALGQQYGGSYAKLMRGTASGLPDRLRLASGFRIDVATATDRQVLDEVARLIAAYLNSLRLEHTAEGVHSGSAYDMFLAKNDLPALPAQGETDVQYSQRLLQKVEALQNPRFVLPYERWLRFHPHVLQFGDQELAGLKIFLRQGAPLPQTVSARSVSPFYLLAGLPLFGVLLGKAGGKRRLPSDWIVGVVTSIFLCAVMAAAVNSPANNGAAIPVSHVGHCVTCHPAPEFTDYRFHNTGAAQEEFDALHGAGSFAQLPVPSYAERSRHPNRYLPPTPSHPRATGIFASVPVLSNPLATDLGMWNIFANSDAPKVQSEMRRLLCDTKPCDPNLQLPRTIALFRTPSLRDLGHSSPFLHTGRMATVEDTLHFYLRMAGLARAGQLRNGDPELTRISLNEDDIAALAAFLRSLDEDYDN